MMVPPLSFLLNLASGLGRRVHVLVLFATVCVDISLAWTLRSPLFSYTSVSDDDSDNWELVLYFSSSVDSVLLISSRDIAAMSMKIEGETPEQRSAVKNWHLVQCYIGIMFAKPFIAATQGA